MPLRVPEGECRCGLPALWRLDDTRGLLSWITAYGLAIVLKKPFSQIRMPKKKEQGVDDLDLLNPNKFGLLLLVKRSIHSS